MTLKSLRGTRFSSSPKPVQDESAPGTYAHRRRGSLAIAVVAALVLGVSGPTVLAASASADSTTAAPLVKYDLNEGSGTTATDTSGNGFNGTLTGGATWAASGKNYGGVTLDGNSGYVNLPNGPLKNLHAVTMSVNVKLTTAKHQWYGTLGYSSSKYIGIEENGSTLTGYFTNSNQQTVAVANVVPGTGTWTNVTLVVDTASATKTMKLYVNGVLKGTTTGITGDISGMYDSTQTFGGYIGKSVWPGDPFLAATVDDFRVYNSALTDAQIATVAANAATVPATAGLVNVSTAPTVAPTLPSTVNVLSTDGTNQVLPITWASISPSQYATSGSFTVSGTTSTTPSLSDTATVYVLPQPTLTLGGKTGTSVTLNWDAEDGATAYNVSRSTTAGSGYTQVYSGTDTTFTDTGLSLGTHYYYILSYAANGAGNSINSPELAVKTDTVLADAPTVSQSSYLLTNRVDLSWAAVSLADSYNVYRSDSEGGTYALVTNTTGTSYKDSDVTQGSTYYYEFSSVNDAGEGTLSAPLAAQTAVDTVPPTTVTSSAQTDATISLNWLTESGATTYNVYRSTTSGSGYSLVYSGDATSDVDSNLVTGTTYYYVVTYTSDLGTSIYSKELSVSTVAVKVPAPSAIKANNTYTNAVNLGWNSVVGANSFKLYRSDSADGTYTLVKSTADNSYTNTGLLPGTTYYYKLSSVNAAGESALSNAFKVTTDTGASTILTNSVQWYDNDGNPIQAGSGSILQYEGIYYWYGGGGGGPFDTNVYSSTDLIHWNFENRIITEGSLGMNGQPAPDLATSSGNHFERDKVIYNPATHMFVFITHYENANYTLAEIGTAYSSTPTGDFTWDHAFEPAGLDSRDSTAYVDTDGTGYIISATDTNSKLTLFKLTPDFLSVDSQMYNIYGGDNSSGIYSGREAPAIVKSDGIYYLVTSAAAGWYPSDAMYSTATADSLADTTAASWKGSTNVDAMGGWDGGGVANYLGNRNDFGGQSVYILPVTGTHGTSYLLMNDTLDPKNSGVGGPMWLPLKLDDGVASIDYSQQININAKTGEVSNIYPGSLLSQGKPATASSSNTTDSDGNVNANGWGASYANDGDYNTEWISSADNYPAYWEVDLGQEYNVNNVQLSWWMIGGSEATEDFTIQVSDDNVNWSTAYDLSSGDKQYGFNNAVFPSVEGRYVKVNILASHTQNNNGGWYVPQLYEARVYGDAAPNSVSSTGPDGSGNYSVQVPSNVVNYPATGDYTLNLGNVTAKIPTADLLSNLGNGALTAANDKTSAATLAAIKKVTPSTTKIGDGFDLSLTSADGSTVRQLGSPEDVTVKLSSSEIALLTAAGTPKLFYYDADTKSLENTNAVFDLTAKTATFSSSELGTFVFEQTALSKLSISPASGNVVAGTPVTFTVTGKDSGSNTANESAIAKFSGLAKSDTRSGNTITFGKTGSRSIKATVGKLTVTAKVKVTAGALASLKFVSPAKSATSGQKKTFKVNGYDVKGNSLGTEKSATFAIENPGTGDSATGSSVTFGQAGTRVVLATVGATQATTNVKVSHGSLKTLTLPVSTAITAGVGSSLTFALGGNDANLNSVGSTVSHTKLKSNVSSDVIKKNKVTFKSAGVHTMTFTDGKVKLSWVVTVS